MPTIICAAVSVCAFTVAGGFSSSISSGIGNQVLLDGSNCGIVNYFPTSVKAALSIMNPYQAQKINNAANYAQQCYSANATGLFDCTSFVKDHLPATTDTQAPCPFQDSICRSNDSNLRLDTGLLDSSEDLGLNTPNDQKILYRAVLHCAPLVTSANFVSNASTSDNYTRYWYGANHVSRSNFTTEFEDLDAQYLRQLDNLQRDDGVNFLLT